MAAKKAILVLQGGGALGAYECGVYRALVPYLRDRGETLAVVAGTSIGAINASLIASHYQSPKHGADVLTTFWREVLPAHSLAVFPDTGIWQRWNAVWTSLLVGNRHLFTPAAPFWPLVPPVSWASLTSFYETTAMEQTLGTYFQSYGGSRSEPRLIVTAVDVERGTSRAFDSWNIRITPHHVVASGSLAPWLPAKELDGRVYWDGGLWSNTPLRDVINALQEIPLHNVGRSETEHAEQEYVAYIVDLFPRRSPRPTTTWEITHRIAAILFGDRTEYDQKFCNAVTHHLKFVRQLHGLVDGLPPGVAQQAQKLVQQIEREYRQLEKKPYVPLRVQRIQRRAGSGEYVSADIDFSLARIDELMEQGEADAAEQLTHAA